MAYKTFVNSKGSKTGDYPGQSTHEKLVGVDDFAGSKYSDAHAIEYRAHKPTDKGHGRGMGMPMADPIRLLFEMDGNFARYLTSLIEGEFVDLHIMLVRNADKTGKHFQKAMELKLLNATIAEVRLATGRRGAESSEVANTKAPHDTSELYEVYVVYERLEGKAYKKGAADGIPWTDDWKNVGNASA